MSRIKGFNLDLPISVIADIKDIFSRIDPSIYIIDWSTKYRLKYNMYLAPILGTVIYLVLVHTQQNSTTTV